MKRGNCILWAPKLHNPHMECTHVYDISISIKLGYIFANEGMALADLRHGQFKDGFIRRWHSKEKKVTDTKHSI